MSTIVKWTPEVIATARAAAVALAEFWDALRLFELESGFEFDGTLSVIESLASDCEAPAAPSDLSDERIVESLDDLDIEGSIR